MSTFQHILGSACLTAIRYLAERALPNASSDGERVALQQIIETDSLDLAYAIAHEQLGQSEEAAYLLGRVATRSRARHSGLRRL
jgi:hypothetical protein